MNKLPLHKYLKDPSKITDSFIVCTVCGTWDVIEFFDDKTIRGFRGFQFHVHLVPEDFDPLKDPICRARVDRAYKEIEEYKLQKGIKKV